MYVAESRNGAIGGMEGGGGCLDFAVRATCIPFPVLVPPEGKSENQRLCVETEPRADVVGGAPSVFPLRSTVSCGGEEQPGAGQTWPVGSMCCEWKFQILKVSWKNVGIPEMVRATTGTACGSRREGSWLVWLL